MMEQNYCGQAGSQNGNYNSSYAEQVKLSSNYKGESAIKKKSALEAALDHLTQTVEGLANDAGELCHRLETVSQPVPMQEKTGGNIRGGSTCYYQNRMDELRERIQTISAGLREAREMLCI